MGSFTFLKSKKIGIFSLGLTGVAAYRAFHEIAQKIIVWDDKPANREEFATKFNANLLVDITNPRWQHLDIIILSPGVPHSHEIFELAKTYNVEIASDIDLLFEQCKTAEFIGITGTNGKSTTTALIYHILKNASLNFGMGGNIGIPVLELPLEHAGYVLELSSFQLDLIKKFKATVAVLLNITPDHLDRHKTMEEYTKAKEKIFNNLESGGFGVIGADNEITKSIFEKYSSSYSRITPISAISIIPNGISVINNKIYDNTAIPLVLELPENKSLQGAHNKENVAASIAACRCIGVEYPAILESLKTFKGLPHRAEYLGSYNNINFYNDSKATNAEAASKSLSFLENVYWLLGGIAKEGGIDDLVPLFNKVKKAYVFGQDKELFASTLRDKLEFEIHENLREAFAAAYSDASKDRSELKNILLAPAAASLDQFKNFEHRGEVFNRLFNDVKDK